MHSLKRFQSKPWGTRCILEPIMLSVCTLRRFKIVSMWCPFQYEKSMLCHVPILGLTNEVPQLFLDRDMSGSHHSWRLLINIIEAPSPKGENCFTIDFHAFVIPLNLWPRTHIFGNEASLWWCSKNHICRVWSETIFMFWRCSLPLWPLIFS